MATVVHSFDDPERFVAGTVGPPGQRTFFLQARQAGRLVSVALEKQQVAVLAERLDLLLDEALRRIGGDPRVPALAPQSLQDQGPLDQPIDEEFRVGTMTLGWDEGANRAVIELFPVSDANLVEIDDDNDDDDEDGEDDPVEIEDEIEIEIEASEVVIVSLEPGYARAFVQRAQTVVSAGRPPCQFCGGPIDPEGHICPRANGFKRTVA
jgi:uncharacterized repeat protein (TIGR03847 family)